MELVKGVFSCPEGKIGLPLKWSVASYTLTMPSPALPLAARPGLPGWSLPLPSIIYPGCTFTAHHEHRQRGGLYWVAYRRRAGRLRRLHLGKPDLLILDRLEAIALSL